MNVQLMRELELDTPHTTGNISGLSREQLANLGHDMTTEARLSHGTTQTVTEPWKQQEIMGLATDYLPTEPTTRQTEYTGEAGPTLNRNNVPIPTIEKIAC